MSDGPWVKIRTRNNIDFRKRNYRKAVLFLATMIGRIIIERKKYGHIIINCPLAEDNRELRFVTVYLVTLLSSLLQMNLQSVTKWQKQEIRKEKKGKEKTQYLYEGQKTLVTISRNLISSYIISAKIKERRGNGSVWELWNLKRGKRETEKSARCGKNARLWSVCGLPNVSDHIFGHKYTRPWPKYEKTYPHSFSILRWKKIEVVLHSWEIVVLEEIILRGSFGLVTLILNGVPLKILLKTSIGDKRYCEFRW